jgi:hypothetical protein
MLKLSIIILFGLAPDLCANVRLSKNAFQLQMDPRPTINVVCLPQRQIFNQYAINTLAYCYYAIWVGSCLVWKC